MLKRLFKDLIVAFSLLLLSPAYAGYQVYFADLEQAQWRSSGNRLECRLDQTIPGYGQAGFKHRATHPLEFRVSANSSPRKTGQALVFISPPSWKQYSKRAILGRVPMSAQKDMIVLPTDWAYRVVNELHEGMEMVWSHADWSAGEDLVTAKVRPLHFDTAWQDFVQCQDNLINYTYEDIKTSRFYFSVNSTSLSYEEKKRLDKVAEYALLDQDYQQISIRAYSDSRGVRKINYAISLKRANVVKNYLINKGVNKEKFIIVAQGEKKPKYNNRTAQGRAKNRRVEVILVK